MNDIYFLLHKKWNYEYHILFAPKYRRKVFYKGKRLYVGAIIRKICEWKGVKIVESSLRRSYYMLVEILLRMNVSSFIEFF